MQTQYSLWLEASRETSIFFHKLRTMAAERLASLAVAPVAAPLPPWLYIKGSGFTPAGPSIPDPFWLGRGENPHDRVITKNRSSGRFSSPRIDVLDRSVMSISMEAAPPFAVLGWDIRENATGLPDLRQWPLPAGLERSGNIIAKLPILEPAPLFVPMAFLRPSELPAELTDEHSDSGLLPDLAASIPTANDVPPGQRIFSTSTMHILKTLASDSGSQFTWESMVSIDLVQRRRTGV